MMDSEPTVSISEYVLRMREVLDEFETQHRAENMVCPEDWPLDMTLAEWDQQLMVFLMTDDEVEKATG